MGRQRAKGEQVTEVRNQEEVSQGRAGSELVKQWQCRRLLQACARDVTMTNQL